MRHFAIMQFEDGGYIVTANADGSVPINAQCVARQDRGDTQGNGLRAIVEQANAANALLVALRGVLEFADPYAVPGCAQNVPAHERAQAAIAQAEGVK